ncbi:MAG: hypothetical protein L0226_13740 [Acidobacteria bacterium]|nr:hypothetical protein [Acidobacteriota bacterium]
MKRGRRRNSKTEVDALSVVDLVEAVERFGAEFYFTGSGSLRVRNMEKLPPALREQFYEADGAQLVAWVKSRKTENKEKSECRTL